MTTYYDELGVPKDATAEQIRQAWKRRAAKLHPDRNSDPEASAAFVRAHQAYAALADESTRRYYDEHGGEPMRDIDQRAGALLVDAFLKLAEANGFAKRGYVGKIRAQLAESSAHHRSNIAELQARLDRLADVIPATPPGAAENVFAPAARHARQKIEGQVRDAQQRLELVRHALALLKPYRDDDGLAVMIEVEETTCRPRWAPAPWNGSTTST